MLYENGRGVEVNGLPGYLHFSQVPQSQVVFPQPQPQPEWAANAKAASTSEAARIFLNISVLLC
jgi:hypothetical protein